LRTGAHEIGAGTFLRARSMGARGAGFGANDGFPDDLEAKAEAN